MDVPGAAMRCRRGHKMDIAPCARPFLPGETSHVRVHCSTGAYVPRRTAARGWTSGFEIALALDPDEVARQQLSPTQPCCVCPTDPSRNGIAQSLCLEGSRRQAPSVCVWSRQTLRALGAAVYGPPPIGVEILQRFEDDT